MIVVVARLKKTINHPFPALLHWVFEKDLIETLYEINMNLTPAAKEAIVDIRWCNYDDMRTTTL